MNNPKVAICILNWNNSLHTIQCMTSIRFTEYKDYKIIIIDNKSTDNHLSEIRRANPDAIIIENTSNLGYADGNWVGVKKALEDPEIQLIWILNNDARLARRNTLKALVDAYRQYPQPAIFGSVILEPDPLSDIDMVHIKRWVDINGKPIFDDIIADTDSLVTDPNPLVEVNSVSGASMLIPVDIIREYGFIDGSYFLYYEDADYCYRLRRAGVACVLVKNSVIDHYHGSAARKGESTRHVIHYYQLRSRIVFHRRHSKRGRYYLEIILGLVTVPMWLVLTPLRGINALRCSQFAFFAVRDAVMNRLGKTFPPEDYLDAQP